MRVALVAALMTVLFGTGAALDFGTPLGAAAAVMTDQQPAAQPQQPSSTVPQEDDGMTSAGWANVLWIVIVVVAGAAFVWLAMMSLRSRSRE